MSLKSLAALGLEHSLPGISGGGGGLLRWVADRSAAWPAAQADQRCSRSAGPGGKELERTQHRALLRREPCPATGAIRLLQRIPLAGRGSARVR